MTDEKKMQQDIPLKLIHMDEVEATNTRWLWYPYIPYGKITIIQGDPGEGKTTLVLHLAAELTQGKMFGAEEQQEPVTVIYQTAEDGLADTIKPRLIAANADCSKVLVIDETEQCVSMTDGRLEAAIQQTNARLVILDPIQAYLGTAVDMHRANEVRPIMAHLGNIAEKYGCAIVLIGHMNKASGQKASYRGLGSIDFAAAARSVLIVARDRENPQVRVMIHAKSSLAPEGKPVAFELDKDNGFRYIGEYDIDPNELLSGSGGKKKSKLAEELLLSELEAGAKAQKDILAKAEECGISKRTMVAAKKALNVKSEKKADGWYWSLPDNNARMQACKDNESLHPCTLEQEGERNGTDSEDKHADYAHMSVGEYKALQDSRKMEEMLRQRQTISKGEATRMEVNRLKEELQAAKQTVRQLEADKDSPYVMFFYATDDKQAYVMQQLEQMGIPFRETENGFEAQECHIKTIRSIEKNYHGQPVSYREQLKEDVDRCLTRATSFNDFLKRLHDEGYSIKQGKYLAAKHWHGERYIRFKSLGEHYTEASLRGLLDEKLIFEKKLAEKTDDAKTKRAPNVMVLLTARGYMDSFITYRLPVRKLWQDRPLTWVNDAELDKLSALNAAINNGETVDTFRRRFHDLTEQEQAAERAIEHMIYMSERDTKKLTDARVHLEEIKAAQKDAAEKLEMIEKIMNGTYMQDMLDKFSERKRSEIVPNGYYNVNTGVRRR